MNIMNIMDIMNIIRDSGVSCPEASVISMGYLFLLLTVPQLFIHYVYPYYVMPNKVYYHTAQTYYCQAFANSKGKCRQSKQLQTNKAVEDSQDLLCLV